MNFSKSQMSNRVLWLNRLLRLKAFLGEWHWPMSGRSCLFMSSPFSVMLLASCAVGPDFETPGPPGVKSFFPASRGGPTGADRIVGQALAHGAEIPALWWELLRSEELNGLVRDAVTHNPDLAAAEAAVRVARANALAQRGPLFPTVDLTMDASRQKLGIAPTVGPPTIDPDSGAVVPGEDTYGPVKFSVVTRQVEVSFVPDVWGGTRRQIEASDAELESQVFQREGVYLTLASNVAIAAIEEARLRGQIQAANRLIELQNKLLYVLRRQFQVGHIGLVDVRTQETALAQAKLLLPTLERDLAKQRNLLAFLTGRFPDEAHLPTFRLASFRLPRTLALSIPGNLVRQRPDVGAAEASLHAANAQIGAAIADRLPQIKLTANTGRVSSNMPDLTPFSGAGAMWFVGGNLTQKVFDAGTLAFKQRAAEESTNQSLAQYRSVVLAAFQNVADVLTALQADGRRVQAAAAAQRAAQQNVDLIHRQLDQGAVDIAVLIQVQRAYLETSGEVVDAQASRLADTVALFQALGGGWWNRREVQDRPPGAQP